MILSPLALGILIATINLVRAKLRHHAIHRETDRAEAARLRRADNRHSFEIEFVLPVVIGAVFSVLLWLGPDGLEDVRVFLAPRYVVVDR